MATLNQLADRLANTIQEPLNFELKERIKDWYKSIRATRIRQSIEKHGIDEEFRLSYVAELELVDKADNCYIEVGCKVLKTKNKIPTLVRFTTDVPFTFVGSVDGLKSYGFRRAYEVHYIKSLDFIGKDIQYDLINKYLYVWNNDKVRYIRVESVFANPEEAVSLCSTDCGYNDDMEFPCPEDMISSIEDEIFKTKLSFVKQDNKEISINDGDKGNVQKVQ